MISTRFYFYLLGTTVSQWLPTDDNPPHNCPNYAVCAPFVAWNDSTIDCPASKCVCQPGTTGPDCDIIDQCAKNPCPKDLKYFNCTSGIGTYQCDCFPEYTGAKCDTPVASVCANNPCFNGGSCKTADGVKYTCQCPTDYFAPNCQYKNPCTKDTCGTHGKCSPLYDGQTFYCTCDYEWIGRYCAVRVTQWTGTATFACFAYDSILLDSSKYKKITDNQMTFSKCNQLLRETTSDCVVYTYFVVMEKNCFLSTDNWFNTTTNLLPNDNDCKKKCPGKDSEVCGTNNNKIIWGNDSAITSAPNTCASLNSSICANSTNFGICITLSPTVNSAGYMCVCKPPYYTNVDQTDCILLADPCLIDQCVNGGSCIHSEDYKSFTCDCPTGFYGDKCQYPAVCVPNPCMYGGTCEDLKNGDYNCHCLTYYKEKNCTEINACDYANPCVNGDCIDLGTGIQVRPRCKCQSGWTGSTCAVEINYCSVLAPCGYNSTCVPSFNNYTCNCIPGINGRNCSEIIDNCVNYKDPSGKEWPNRCKTKDGQAECVNAINSFSCNCSEKWRGQYCELNVIIEQVMLSLFGEVNYQLLPLLNDLLNSPTAINNMVPFYLGTMLLANRTDLSWDYDEMFYWATFEEKELDIGRDFFKWNDVVLGNCFTFNHYNNSMNYNYRSSKSKGLKVRMKINQEEYEPWTETAAMMVFIHNRLDYIFSESIRYNAEPNNEVKLYPYGSQFTRLGGSYGRCVDEPSEVKSYYYPGRYTADGCYRSCYQDLIKKECNCMDPRYPMPDGESACVVTDMNCIDSTILQYGDPSGWSFCVCPVPCKNQNFAVEWSKSSYRSITPNCIRPAANVHNTSCQSATADSVIINVAVPKLTFSLYQETPQMDLNNFIGSLGGLLGVLMGIGAIAFIEVIVAAFRLCSSICCFDEKKAIKEWEQDKIENANYRKPPVNK